MDKVYKLTDDEAKLLTVDARVAAIRWDLISWCLTLDLDVPSSEAKSAPMHRAWIIFDGVSDVHWPLLNTRLPNGCWLTDKIAVKKLYGKFYRYSFDGLLPSFDTNGVMVGNPTHEITIKAISMIGLCSIEAEIPEDGFLSIKKRVSLASDDEFLRVYEEIT